MVSCLDTIFETHPTIGPQWVQPKCLLTSSGENINITDVTAQNACKLGARTFLHCNKI